METEKQYSAFEGFSRIAGGNLEAVLRKLWEIREEGSRLLIFEDETGLQVDFDLHGSLQEVLARHLPPQPKKGPGRPRLGVVSREVSLLPRHWEWLERQPQTPSGTLRRLVEAARKNDATRAGRRERLEAADRFLWSIAGDLEDCEEVSRALYAGNWPLFDELIRPWPQDIGDHVSMMVRPVREA
ncbi:MAG: DUF2239 family protein [Spirochaetales bacterium]|nr:DUF2239 family protein [Spirochaetales bacterium]